MRVAVVGGTGLVGRYMVEALERERHEAVVLARSRGVDVTTGAGLDGALAGVEFTASGWPWEAVTRSSLSVIPPAVASRFTSTTAAGRTGASKLRILHRSAVGLGIPLVPQFGDETDDAFRQNIGLLERRKMATRLRDGPAPEIEESLRQRAWGANDLAYERLVP